LIAVRPAGCVGVRSPSAALRRYRRRFALASIFFVDGAAFGLWVAHLPLVQEHVRLSAGGLSIALAGASAGAVVGTVLGTRAALRCGDRRTIGAALACVLTFALVLLKVRTAPVLDGAAICFGIALGVAEVAMNALAARVERAIGLKRMSSFHAAWSAGLLSAAGATAALLALHVDDVVPPVLALAVLATFAMRGLPSVPAFAAPTASTRRGRLSPPVARLSAIAFCGWIAEGALTDWSPVYLHDVARATPALAAAGATCYGLAMFGSRLCGDALTERFGARRMLLGGSIGMLVALAAVRAGIGFGSEVVGFAISGAAVANLSPVVFTLAGRYGASAVGAVSGIGYIAFVTGPALYGGIAHLFGLPTALALPAAGALGVASLAIGLHGDEQADRP